MPLFKYAGFTAQGSATKGEIEADSLSAAKTALMAQNIYLQRIAAVTHSFSFAALRHMSLRELLSIEIGQAKLKLRDLATFNRQFATLIAAGMPLTAALDALIEQGGPKPLLRALQSMRRDVKEGRNLSDAMDKFGGLFGKEMLNMVRAAESSGKLPEALTEAADMSEDRQQLSSQLKSALTYPVVMLVVGLGIVWFLLVSVVPQITEMFADLGQALPPATQALLAISDFLQNHGLVLAVALGLAFYGVKMSIASSAKLRLVWHKTLLGIPVIGGLLRRTTLARFTRTLSALLQAGVPILTALTIAREVTTLLPYRQALKQAIQDVSEGKALAAALGATKLFPPMLIGMVKVGEKSGKTDEMLTRVADAYAGELKADIAALTSLIQPLLLLLMGGLIAFIMIAVLLPIFDLNTLAGDV